MKKFLQIIFCAILSVTLLVGFGACSQDSKDSVSVYMPDGAPALSMTWFMHESNKDTYGRDVSYEVVDASTIQTYVTGENPKADICVLPVNLASKLLGTGETYKMLGTVTHGNLYLLKKTGGEDITVENLNSLVGKTVGVINLVAVPGLTFKLILKDNGIEYNELGNDGEPVTDKVNLRAVTAMQVLPSAEDCDYFVVPEPDATTKVNATNGALSFAGDLQNLYGGENGYPQAVIVAKNSFIENNKNFMKSFLNGLCSSESSVYNCLSNGKFTPEEVVQTVTSHLSDGMSPKFTTENLNKEVVKNCAINFVKSADCKEEVNAFIDKLIAVNSGSANKVAEDFYYIY